MIDRSDYEPIYVQIQNWMLRHIQSGQWPAGYQLPAETNLARQLEVNRGTLRKAIQNLAKDGYLTQKHGKGTFVSKRLDQPLAQRLVTVSEALEQQGTPFVTVVLDQQTGRGHAAAENALGCGPEDLFFLRRLRLIDNEPVVLFENYVNVTVCPHIAQHDFATKKLFAAIESDKCAHIGRAQRRFQAIAAQDTVARALQVRRHTPIMYLEQTTHLTDNRAVEFSHVWMRGDQFGLVVELTREQP